MARTPGSTTTTDTVDKPANASALTTPVAYVRSNPAALKSVAMPFGEMPDHLQNAAIVPKADPVPTASTDDVSDKKRDNIAAAGRHVNEEEHVIRQEKRTSAYNAKGDETAEELQEEQDEANINKEHAGQYTNDHDQKDDDKSKKHKFLDAIGITAAVGAAHQFWKRHHWIRDALLLKRIGRIAAETAEAKRLKRDAKLAEDAERDKRLLKDGKQVDHDGKLLKDGEQAGHDVHRADEAAHVGHDLHTGEKVASDFGKTGRLALLGEKALALPRILKHVAIGGGLAFGSGFILKRVVEGEIIRELARDTHPDKADQWAHEVMTRSPLNKDAREALKKGDYWGVVKAEVKGTFDDMTALYDYLKDPDKMKKDFAEAQDSIQALAVLLKENPTEGKKVLLQIAQDAELFEGVVLDNKGTTAEALRGALMGDDKQQKQALGALKTAVLDKPGATDTLADHAAKTLDYLKPVIDPIVKTRAGSPNNAPVPLPHMPLKTDRTDEPQDTLG